MPPNADRNEKSVFSLGGYRMIREFPLRVFPDYIPTVADRVVRQETNPGGSDRPTSLKGVFLWKFCWINGIWAIGPFNLLRMRRAAAV